ncbi:hypothetical protein M3Y97_01067800 [Aphelenchoides bicaudatus]|nr:hypothetical protein M3Y97_01067800 [Aphelenchoides bicaudatus]
MSLNKMIVLAVLAVLAFNVQADNGEITDWCPPCKRLIDDFTPGLKNTHAQDFYDRVCDDVYQEDKDFNAYCRQVYDTLFTEIRDALNAGKTTEQVCTSLGACQADSQARQKFATFRQHHAKFQKLFSKAFLNKEAWTLRKTVNNHFSCKL